MRIAMIHGQNHRGSTYHAGRLLADRLAEELDEFFLPRDLNHFCTGCYQCIEDEMKCPFYVEKQAILSAMERADLIIFTTPNYCMGPSASMKALLDLLFDCWMTHRPREWMFHKKAAVICTTAGMGARQAIRCVKQSLAGWGIPCIKTYGIGVQAMNWDGVRPEKKRKIERDMARLANRFARIQTPRVGLRTRLTFRMMAGMHRAGWDASPAERQYWEERGWLGRARPWHTKA